MPSTSNDTPHRLPADERRRQLIEVAIDLFARRGFSGTTTKEIASAAGVTEAIIFRHFATKEQLYSAILDHRKQALGSHGWLAEIKECMDNNDDEGLFRHIVSKVIEVVRRDPKFERVMLYAALEGHELAALYHKKFSIPIMDLLREYIARRQKEGALRELTPDAIMFAVGGMAQQYATHVHMCNYRDAGFGDAEAVEIFTGILMRGVLAESTPQQVSKAKSGGRNK